ncbi:MAG: YkvA family protein [Gammaproteobacteria bacterium]|nr:YkvA family protein [Gammaproteobacteria bacterium]
MAAKVPLAEIRESLQASIRLLRAYANGQYRDIPWESLVSIIAAIVYFVMPLDLIPDFILAFGLIDDAALLGWILSSVKKDIDRFAEWEKTSTNEAPDQTEE